MIKEACFQFDVCYTSIKEVHTMRVTTEKLQKIIALANDRAEKGKAIFKPNVGYSMAEIAEKGKTPEGVIYHEACQQLRQYLLQMDYDELIEVETLMVYGRQWHQSIEEDQPSVRECFLNFKEHVGKPDGKGMAVSYIAEKAPLGDYLRTALKHCDPAKIVLF